MGKFFGVIFLGQPREARLAQAHEAGWFERIGLLWLAAGCVLLGLFPTHVVGLLAQVPRLLGVIETLPGIERWWQFTPVAGRHASYAPLVFLAVIAAIFLLTVVLVRSFYHSRTRRAAPWDCGFVRVDARMQDTAEGFGQPIRHIFQPFFRMRRRLPTPFDATPRYSVEVGDRIWIALYQPLAGIVHRAAAALAWLQQGRISTYLLYGFVTLIALLAVVL
jgi:hypothetical protein